MECDLMVYGYIDDYTYLHYDFYLFLVPALIFFKTRESFNG